MTAPLEIRGDAPIFEVLFVGMHKTVGFVFKLRSNPEGLDEVANASASQRNQSSTTH